MGNKLIANLLSKMMMVESVILLVPTAVSLIYGEFLQYGIWFLVTAAAVAVIFAPIVFLTKSYSQTLYAREAFCLVALCWIVWSAAGALPFMLTGTLPNFFDAFFEAVSGFTTTGATVFADVESLPKCVLLWRSLMHWIGGMGVLVFALAILPMTKTGNYMNLFRAEMTGSDVGKLVPKAKTTAFILYGIYTAMTAVLTVLLICGGMSVFDSVNHAMSTAGTGGMSVKNASIAAYDSAYIDIVITAFMFLMGVNFTMYFLIIRGKTKDIFKSAELRFYTLAFVAISLGIAADLFFTTENGSFWHCLRLSAFQTASFMSSTGFATADTNVWPILARTVLIACMIVGACAGSTGGGVKVSRVQIASKTIYRDIKRQVSPRFVYEVRSEGKIVDNYTINSVMTFIVCYMGIVMLSVFLLSFDPIMEIDTCISSVISGLGNMGPFFSKSAPTVSNFEFMSALSKITICADMLLGRLEIFPFIILASAITSKRKNFR